MATERTKVRRHPERGAYDRETIESILDEALICHVGFVHEARPFVIPTIHARVADTLYLHGSPGSRMLRTLGQGIDVCVTATLLDGLVLARSVYHHSMNYRSVVVIGRAREVTDRDEKLRGMEADGRTRRAGALERCATAFRGRAGGNDDPRAVPRGVLREDPHRAADGRRR